MRLTDFLSFKRLRAEHVIPLVAALMLGVLWTHTLVRIQIEKRQAIDTVLDHASSWAARLAERTDRLLRQADVTTQLAGHLYERTSALDVPMLLNERLLPKDLAATLTIVDPQGDVVASSQALSGHVNVADRESFQAHLNSATDTLHISAPVESRITGRWAVPLSRAIRDAAGRLIGVAAMVDDPREWLQPSDLAQISNRSVAAIVGTDGIYRVRVADGVTRFGERVAPDWLIAEIDRRRTMRQALPSPVDHVPRFTAYRKLDDYPLYVAVGFEHDTALAGFRQWRIEYLLQMAVWSAITVAVAVALSSLFLRVRRSLDSAEAARQDFAAASAGSLDGFFLLRAVRSDAGELVDFVCRDVNQRGAGLFERSREALLGERLTAMLPHARTSGFLVQCIGVVDTGRVVERELEVSTEPIAAQWVHYYMVPVGDGVAVTVRDITGRKRDECARERDRAFMKAMLDHLPVAVAVKSVRDGRSGPYLFTNRAAHRIYGRPAGAMIGATAHAVFDAASAQRFAEQDAAVLARGSELFFAEQPFDGNYGRRWLNMTKVPVFDAEGHIEHLMCITEDVTDRQATQEQLRMSQQILHQAAEALVVTNEAGRITMVNPAFTDLTGYAEAEAIGRDAAELGVAPLEGLAPPDAGRGGDSWVGEAAQHTRDGRILPCWVSASRWGSSTHGPLVIRLLSDISSIKAVQARLETLALHDSLTGLPNRALFQAKLGQAVDRARPAGGSIAVYFVDLDDFKSVNDTLGHEAGDALLVEVARRLSACVRSGDTVSRLGGDEFTIIAERLRALEDAALLGERIAQALARPVRIGAGEIRISGSVGVCLYPRDGANATELLRNADQAMYWAKQQGKNGYRLFGSEAAGGKAAGNAASGPGAATGQERLTGGGARLHAEAIV